MLQPSPESTDLYTLLSGATWAYQISDNDLFWSWGLGVEGGGGQFSVETQPTVLLQLNSIKSKEEKWAASLPQKAN